MADDQKVPGEIGLISEYKKRSRKTVPEPAPDDAGAPERKLEFRGDGSLRRMGGGARSFGDFFSKENSQKPMHRGHLLGLFEMLAYAQRENKWYKRFYRWLFKKPGPPLIWETLARNYDRHTVQPVVEAIAAARREKGKAILKDVGAPAPQEGL